MNEYKKKIIMLQIKIDNIMGSINYKGFVFLRFLEVKSILNMQEF